MITTNNFQLSKKEYFILLLTIFLKKRWWLFVYMWVFAIFFLFIKNRGQIENFLIILGFIYPFVYVLQYWRFAYSKENEIFLQERYYEINDDKLIGYINNNSESTFDIRNIIKTANIGKHYLLYISKNQFIYIPNIAFKSNEDKQWFENKFFTKH